jgi:hypothetical protein
MGGNMKIVELNELLDMMESGDSEMIAKARKMIMRAFKDQEEIIADLNINIFNFWADLLGAEKV